MCSAVLSACPLYVMPQATVQNPTGLKDFADGFNRLTLLPTVSEEVGPDLFYRRR